jgi:hypothetical protein
MRERRLQALNRRRENPPAVNDLPHAERSGETLDQPRRRNQKGAVHTKSTGLRLSRAGCMALLRASADRCDGFRERLGDWLAGADDHGLRPWIE